MTRNNLTLNAWRWKCGLPEKEDITKPVQLSYEEIKESQWNPKFEKLRLNRMILGFF